MTDSMVHCSICKVQILELPAYKYCECEHCEGHQISGFKMGCEHEGNVNLADLQKTINRYRSGALDDIIRGYKKDKAKREGVEKRVRPFVAKGVEEKHEPTKKS